MKKYQPKQVKVHCMEAGPKAEAIKQQIEAGHAKDFSTQINEQVSVKRAQQCVQL